MRIDMIRGFQSAKEGPIGLLTGKDKQFSAVLVGAEPGAKATVKIHMLPDDSKARKVLVATLELSADTPYDVTPVIESLIAGHFAEVTAIDSGEVWVHGHAGGE